MPDFIKVFNQDSVSFPHIFLSNLGIHLENKLHHEHLIAKPTWFFICSNETNY